MAKCGGKMCPRKWKTDISKRLNPWKLSIEWILPLTRPRTKVSHIRWLNPSRVFIRALSSDSGLTFYVYITFYRWAKSYDHRRRGRADKCPPKEKSQETTGYTQTSKRRRGSCSRASERRRGSWIESSCHFQKEEKKEKQKKKKEKGGEKQEIQEEKRSRRRRRHQPLIVGLWERVVWECMITTAVIYYYILVLWNSSSR